MNTTISQGTAAGGGSLAMVTILIYVMSLKGIQIPDTVAVAIASIFTTIFHYLIALGLMPRGTAAILNENRDK
jgi:hypothetical protein